MPENQTRRSYRTHPFAALFEKYDAEERTALLADVREHGQIVPIKLGTLSTGRTVVVDGNNLYGVVLELGLEPKFEHLPDDTNLDDYILSVNVVRRHMTKGQQAMAIAMVYPDGGRGGPGNPDPARMPAATAGILHRRLEIARQLLRLCRALPDSDPMRKYPEKVLGDREFSLDNALDEVRDITESRQPSSRRSRGESVPRPRVATTDGEPTPEPEPERFTDRWWWIRSTETPDVRYSNGVDGCSNMALIKMLEIQRFLDRQPQLHTEVSEATINLTIETIQRMIDAGQDVINRLRAGRSNPIHHLHVVDGGNESQQ